MKIIVLTDYKNHFETKFTASPYRSGMDKEALKEYFSELGYQIEYKQFHQVDFNLDEFKNNYFLYTSSEDIDGFYKSYIEDIVYGISLSGGIPIPSFKYLKAHHNKVFMEILRSQSDLETIKSIKSRHYGTLEEFQSANETFERPIIVKPASGSMSKGVSLNKTLNEATKSIQLISKSGNLYEDLKDHLRRFKHNGYLSNSRYRKKFVAQNYIQGLKGDWKILIYSDKYYVLERKNRKGDFRASGGGNLSFTKDVPKELLNFSQEIHAALHVPNLSLDICKKKDEYYLIEFQTNYFGTYTLEYSDFYFKKRTGTWETIEEKSILEKVYAESIVSYINQIKNDV